MLDDTLYDNQIIEQKRRLKDYKKYKLAEDAALTKNTLLAVLGGKDVRVSTLNSVLRPLGLRLRIEEEEAA